MSDDIAKPDEFAEWTVTAGDPFEDEVVGPFYYRQDENGYVAAFRAGRKHTNTLGVIHGGCLMTFADFALFGIGHEELGDNSTGLTIAFTSEFLDSGNAGDLIEARGEVLRAGHKIMFVRGLITANGKPCMNFSGTIKRVRLNSDE